MIVGNWKVIKVMISIWSCPNGWRYLNGWMVDVMENPNLEMDENWGIPILGNVHIIYD